MDFYTKKNDSSPRGKHDKTETQDLICKTPVITKKARHIRKHKNRKKFLKYLEENNLKGKQGDVWIWSAIEPESKYLFPDIVGQRNRPEGRKIMKTIKQMRANKDDSLLIQTDGYKLYSELIMECFSKRVTKWVKRHGEQVAVEAEMPETILHTMLQKHRDALGHINEISVKVVTGSETEILKILKAHNSTQGINTSYIERSNLNRRLFNARLRRKTIAFSKDYDCLLAQLNLQRAYANFCWAHHTLTKKAGIPTSPAMAIGKTDRIWSLNELLFYPISC